MKKSLFKVLCMVLIIALLAPNAFAATPAPEAPLADAATVERVKQEIAAGEITDMEDLFLVAYQHLGADLEEEGMTAYINEDGTLGITQIIENDNDGASVYSLNGSTEEKMIAVAMLGAYNNGGELLSNIEYTTYPFNAYGNDNEGYIYVIHTMYVSGQYDPYYGRLNPLCVRLSSISTQISHSSTLHLASELEQGYEVLADIASAPVSGSRTMTWPGSGTHVYTPVDTGWHNPTNASSGGYMMTYSQVVIPSIPKVIFLKHKWEFQDIADLI